MVKIYLKKGSLFIHYFTSSSGGLRLSSFLRLLGLTSQDPVRIKDVFYSDCTHGQRWNIGHLSFKASSAQLKKIEHITQTCLPFLNPSEIEFYSINVRKAWDTWLESLLLLRVTGKRLAYEKNLPLGQVVLVSPFASLIEFLELDHNSAEEIEVIGQPFRNKALLYLLGASWLSFWRLVRKCAHILFKLPIFSSIPIKIESQNVGIEAAWHLSSPDQSNKIILDNLFWWRESTIPPERIRFFYDRPNVQPTFERLEITNALGIKSILLDSRFCGDAPELLLGIPEPHKKVWDLLNDLWLSGKFLYRNLFSDELTRSVLTIIHWYYIKSEGLADIYKHMGIQALFYMNEGGFDVFSLAAKSADAIRIGFQWTCLPGIDAHISARSTDVFFFWGQHDLQIALDAGCVSKHMLVSGCFIIGRSNQQARDDAKSKVNGFRKLGVNYVITVFDTSSPTPNFYRFLLEWLIKDPALGLLIKSKGCRTWADVTEFHGNTSLDNSFSETLQCAIDTQRIHMMSTNASPGDAASVSDFTLGVGTLSSTAVAALAGGKVFFVDYERLDQDPQNLYTIFHSLGPNRCIFYDLETLKKEVLKHAVNPKDNPLLGDPSPILYRLDSFCDSGASRRIAEYVEWYMEGLAHGLSRDVATLSATRKYAEKWGKDKVFRGL